VRQQAALNDAGDETAVVVKGVILSTERKAIDGPDLSADLEEYRRPLGCYRCF